MGWLKKQLRSIAKRNPANKIMNAAGISPNNTLRQVLDPMAVAHQNIADGKPMTLSNTLDPGHFVSEPDYAPKVQTVNPNNARNLVAAQMSGAPAAAQTRGGGMLMRPSAPAPNRNYGDIASMLSYVQDGQPTTGIAPLNGGMVNEGATPEVPMSMAGPKSLRGDFLVNDPKRLKGRIYT